MATRRELLELLQDELIVRVDQADAKDLPALSRELRMVLGELDAIPDEKSNSPADEVARQREERRRRAAERQAADG